jgi:hypothetical protein
MATNARTGRLPRTGPSRSSARQAPTRGPRPLCRARRRTRSARSTAVRARGSPGRGESVARAHPSSSARKTSPKRVLPSQSVRDRTGTRRRRPARHSAGQNPYEGQQYADEAEDGRNTEPGGARHPPDCISETYLETVVRWSSEFDKEQLNGRFQCDRCRPRRIPAIRSSKQDPGRRPQGSVAY